MKKIDRAVEIIRGWSDEELSRFLNDCSPEIEIKIQNMTDKELRSFIQEEYCPAQFKIREFPVICEIRNESKSGSCPDCWNEEVEE